MQFLFTNGRTLSKCEGICYSFPIVAFRVVRTLSTFANLVSFYRGIERRYRYSFILRFYFKEALLRIEFYYEKIIFLRFSYFSEIIIYYLNMIVSTSSKTIYELNHQSTQNMWKCFFFFFFFFFSLIR